MLGRVDDQRDDLVPVRRFLETRRAQDYALVLTAAGIRSFVVSEGGAVAIYVAVADRAIAQAELAQYDQENRDSGSRPVGLRLVLPPIEVATVYWAVLLFFFAAARRGAFSIDWLAAGAAEAGAILDGQLWRAATALCLHVTVTHLLGNLFFGALFAYLLAQVTGPGVAWLSMLVAGIGGNLLNAFLQPPTHGSIGASTAIFAGLGLLVALRQTWTHFAGRSGLRKWAPLVGGLVLLALLGVGGPQTDVLAHICGFAFGLGIGLLLARSHYQWSIDRALQWRMGGIALMILIVSWSLALVA